MLTDILGWTDAQLADLDRVSIESAFLDHTTRQRLRERRLA